LLLARSTVAHGSNTYDKSPYVFYYNTVAETWVPASFSPNEIASWNGSPNELVTDDNGDLLLCGRDNVLGSTDGKVWSVRSNLRSFIYAPIRTIADPLGSAPRRFYRVAVHRP